MCCDIGPKENRRQEQAAHLQDGTRRRTVAVAEQHVGGAKEVRFFCHVMKR
jgi:hypothetical protein